MNERVVPMRMLHEGDSQGGDVEELLQTEISRSERARRRKNRRIDDAAVGGDQGVFPSGKQISLTSGFKPFWLSNACAGRRRWVFFVGCAEGFPPGL